MRKPARTEDLETRKNSVQMNREIITYLLFRIQSSQTHEDEDNIIFTAQTRIKIMGPRFNQVQVVS